MDFSSVVIFKPRSGREEGRESRAGVIKLLLPLLTPQPCSDISQLLTFTIEIDALQFYTYICTYLHTLDGPRSFHLEVRTVPVVNPHNYTTYVKLIDQPIVSHPINLGRDVSKQEHKGHHNIRHNFIVSL